MNIKFLHSTVDLERSDYFFLSADGPNSFRLVLTDGTRHPLTMRGLTRKQVGNLAAQVARLFAQEQAEAAAAVVEHNGNGTAQPILSQTEDRLANFISSL